MKLIQLAILALLLGACTPFVVSSQPPGYGPPPSSSPSYDQDRDYDRYDDYDYDRGYYQASSPRSEVGFFYDELSPYGDWVLTRDLGWAWFPRDVHPYWRPYREGRWVVTEYGWTWVSDEPFGWATYHYGRWSWDPHFGWLWVPGTVWGPAWVSWQHGGGYVGWAPLPPAVGFEVGIGIRLGGFDLRVGIRPDSYSFVQERSFLEPRLSSYVIPTARNVTIIHYTTNTTNYTYVDNRVVNSGVDVRSIEQATGRRTQRLQITEGRTRAHSEVAQNEVRIFRADQRQLESVRVAVRTNAGLRAETPRPGRDDRQPTAGRPDNRVPIGRENQRPSTSGRAAPEFQVAPRVGRVPQRDAQQIERQERRAAQELVQYQRDERRRLERVQEQELRRVVPSNDRAAVERQHQAELTAMRQQQRNAAQQLEARQGAERRAARSRPAAVQPSRRDGEKTDDPSKDKKERQDPQERQGHGTPRNTR